MNKYLGLKKSNCKNCYKCIRHCPVKAIKFSDNQAHIVEDECVLCGQCFVNCPQNAKEIRNDVSKAKELIASGKPVIVSIAPSFVANFDNVNFTSMKKALLELGFSDAEETAVGAAIVSEAYDNMVNAETSEVIISSCCHSVNTLIQKYYPEAISSLAHVKSPMLAHCDKIKRERGDCYTVFIGPCISKKSEAEMYEGITDCVLTYEELTEWMFAEKVTFTPCEDTVTGGKSRLYPITSGILKTMKKDNPSYVYLAIDGMENCMKALKDVVDGNLSHCFIEMSACAGSCVGGPVMDKKHRALVREILAVNKYAPENKFDYVMPTEDQIKKDIPFVGLHRTMPGSTAVQEILKQMGKTKPEDELNCGSCGYDTCREKAVAVIQGKADLSMCLPYLKEKAESFSDTIIKNTPNGIIVLNEDLEVQQINAAARNIMNIKYAGDVLGNPVIRILEPGIFMEVLSSGRNVHNKKAYLAEYDKYVEETIIYDKSYHIVMAIMRDITDEEKQRNRKENVSRNAVEITDKVIEKHMRVVQEIASLLGETTAETKVALTNLKETLTDE